MWENMGGMEWSLDGRGEIQHETDRPLRQGVLHHHRAHQGEGSLPLCESSLGAGVFFQKRRVLK